MKIAYLDCSSGISGDMCLGALVDAGLSVKSIEKELKKIPLKGYKLTSKKVKRSHFSARKVTVSLAVHEKGKRLKRWRDIERLIQKSSLSSEIKEKGQRIFKSLFKAEAKVHGESLDTVHLHELGAIDTTVDIFGTIIGLSMLGIEKVYASPINLGSGSIELEDHILTVPAPATAELLRKIPVYSRYVPYELTTPTGAAIVRELSSGFGEMPLMKIESICSGAGDKNFKNRPNILRIFIGEQLQISKQHAEQVTVIEATIDDMSPQIYEYVMKKLFKAGARDVYLTQVIMKKGRPGVKITVLSDNEKKELLMEIILKETSTTGLRFHEMKRRVLCREIKKIDTKFGKVRVKFSKLGDSMIKATPEYEDCKRIADKTDIPLIEIIKKAR